MTGMDPGRPGVVRAGMKLSALYAYPIKSCRGIGLERAVVGPTGIRGDRRWMLADPAGRFLSQRSYPRLARIQPEPRPDRLVVTAPGRATLEVGLGDSGARTEVEIWDDRCRGVDEGDEAAAWFSDFLGTPVRLVRQAPEARRQVDPAFARSPGDRVSFTDGYPFLLTTRASLDDLNARLSEPLPMDRFRPNLVVEKSGPWDEDHWRALRIGDLELDVVKPCARCAITTVDQETGRRGKEPLRTLATFRRTVPGAPPGSEESVFFGQYLVHRGHGVLEVEARVEILTA